MKRQIQARASAHLKNAHVIEHTPIYDLEAYKKRQKTYKFNLFRIKLYKGISLCCIFSFTFSILFLGE